MKDGIIIVNKPAGKTSHQIVSQARKTLNIKKVGHGGTLDPMAEGVLVILVGRGTKLSELLLCQDKQYIAEMTFGIQTDTLDTSGSILRRSEVHLTPDLIENALAKFRGTIEQVPPMYSAVKQDGKKLYELARQGISVERKKRMVTIHELTLLETAGSKAVISVTCSKGTYIRTLIDDIGRHLGCYAAMSALTRTKSGRFCINDAVSPENITEDSIIPVNDIFEDIPIVTVVGNTEKRVRNGNPIKTDLKDFFLIKVFAKDELICLAESHDGILQPKIMLSEGK